MVGRLKTTLKAELEALKSGQPMPAPTDTASTATPKKTATPRKRKGKGDEAEKMGAEDAGDGSPKKRGRKPKKADVKAEEDDEEMAKMEVKDEGEAEEV